jgi:hypothetical protein
MRQNVDGYSGLCMLRKAGGPMSSPQHQGTTSPMPRRATPLPPTSFRKPRDLTFRKNDVVRAFKAAWDAGIPNPRIEVDRDGTISITAGEPAAKNDTANSNPWDKVLTNAADQDRPA